MTRERKRTARNLIIFTVLIIGLGWLASGVDALIGATSPEESLGMLIWLVTPAGVSLLLRAFAGDGWKDLGIRPHFKGNWGAYAVSLLVYPVGVGVIIAVGLAFGAISFQSVAPDADGALVQTLIALLIPQMIQNVPEELGFRGYVAPKVYSLGLNIWVAHALVGLIWGVWHLPFLRAITPYTSESLLTLAPRFLISTIAVSIVYGEIRLRTESVWPAILMQTAGGVAVGLAMSYGVISVAPASAFIFNPVTEGVFMIVIMTLVGVGLYAWRKQSTSA